MTRSCFPNSTDTIDISPSEILCTLSQIQSRFRQSPQASHADVTAIIFATVPMNHVIHPNIYASLYETQLLVSSFSPPVQLTRSPRVASETSSPSETNKSPVTSSSALLASLSLISTYLLPSYIPTFPTIHWIYMAGVTILEHLHQRLNQQSDHSPVHDFNNSSFQSRFTSNRQREDINSGSTATLLPEAQIYTKHHTLDIMELESLNKSFTDILILLQQWAVRWKGARAIAERLKRIRFTMIV